MINYFKFKSVSTYVVIMPTAITVQKPVQFKYLMKNTDIKRNGPLFSRRPSMLILDLLIL
ncbi:hypothetical protein TH53_07690 [Pedobacter lusitanus]|uniref:Uncharacterized protein n=1 Tax=Pedobacter lusitanus TaxID=1503925 RepID=A0A0D0GKR2_9SPHI|nr:hypothetical protein TH53_07690 [Pedobacter lusitanus]